MSIQRVIEAISSLSDVIHQHKELSDTIINGFFLLLYILFLEFYGICNEVLKDDVQPDQPFSILQSSSTTLYNLCRSYLKELEKSQNQQEYQNVIKLRYYCCLLLHSSILHSSSPIPTDSQSLHQLLSVIPDVLRAYQHTSRLLKENNMMIEYENCFQQGILILDKIEPVLHQIQSGSSIHYYIIIIIRFLFL